MPVYTYQYVIVTITTLPLSQIKTSFHIFVVVWTSENMRRICLHFHRLKQYRQDATVLERYEPTRDNWINYYYTSISSHVLNST